MRDEWDPELGHSVCSYRFEPGGRVTRMSHHAFGLRLTAVTNPDGGGYWRRYLETGDRVRQRIREEVSGSGDSLWQETYYDGFGVRIDWHVKNGRRTPCSDAAALRRCQPEPMARHPVARPKGGSAVVHYSQARRPSAPDNASPARCLHNQMDNTGPRAPVSDDDPHQDGGYPNPGMMATPAKSWSTTVVCPISTS